MENEQLVVSILSTHIFHFRRNLYRNSQWNSDKTSQAWGAYRQNGEPVKALLQS